MIKGKDGLYAKKKSAVVESVKQTEGLYRKVEKVEIVTETLSDEQRDAVSTLENSISSKKRTILG